MDDLQSKPGSDVKPIWLPNTEENCKKSIFFEKLLSETYRKNEIVVFFDKVDNEKDLAANIEEVKASFKEDGFNPENIEVVRCSNCDIPVVLFKASGIHSVVNSSGVKGGTSPASTKAGEEYSLNFYNNIPSRIGQQADKFTGRKTYYCKKKNSIVVAVLDTGIDTDLVNEQYIWKDDPKDEKDTCYADVHTGWNFINNSDNVYDDDLQKHGSIVSQYIIDGFENSSETDVLIMPLKTHDASGVGDLFHSLCAIHFAIAKGANIINASWGFYYYHGTPIPYLDRLISQILPQKGILFITAAGNKNAEEEILARQLYTAMNNGAGITDEQLRDLAIHNFYPANLSNDHNSVITVTTTDSDIVSPTQNYSSRYVDLGVTAHQQDMTFNSPLPNVTPFCKGSSFAAAIACGVIGAYSHKRLFRPGLQKKDFFRTMDGTNGGTQVLFYEYDLEVKYIKEGANIGTKTEVYNSIKEQII